MKQGQTHYRVVQILEDGEKPFLASFVVDEIVGSAEGRTKEANYFLRAIKTRPASNEDPSYYLVEEVKTLVDSDGTGHQDVKFWGMREPSPALAEVLRAPHLTVLDFFKATGWVHQLSRRI